MKEVGLLTIVPPPNAGDGLVKTGAGARFLFPDGSEFKQVARAVITFAYDEVLTAVLDVAIDPTENIEAHPMLSLDAVRNAAFHYGYDLSKLPSFAFEGGKPDAEKARNRG